MEPTNTTKQTYLTPWTGIDKKPYNRASHKFIALFLLTPVQYILLAIAVYLGTMNFAEDPMPLMVAVGVCLVSMVLRALFEKKVSDNFDEVSTGIHYKVWANLENSVNAKFGEGTLINAEKVPEKSGLPTGDSGFLAWVDRMLVGTRVKVEWTPRDGDTEYKYLDISRKTFEPTFENRMPPHQA